MEFHVNLGYPELLQELADGLIGRVFLVSGIGKVRCRLYAVSL